MLQLKGWRPINWPGDSEPATGPRRRLDWIVLAAMLLDGAFFVTHFGPRLTARPWPPSAFLALPAMLAVWLGPFLGLLLRRGRGAALLSYAIVKLAIVLAFLGWWWGHRLADERVSPALLAAPILWNFAGAAASLTALAWPARTASTARAVILDPRDS